MAADDAPPIDQALESFLAAKRAAAKPRAFMDYAEIVELLKLSLNGYAYDSLDRFERRRWVLAQFQPHTRSKATVTVTSHR
jgi:hypothetical protein